LFNFSNDFFLLYLRTATAEGTGNLFVEGCRFCRGEYD
jgi:hypothetical protein